MPEPSAIETEVSLTWSNFLTHTYDRLNDLVANFKAGRLQEHSDFWYKLTNDRSILRTIKYGIRIEFDKLPKQTFIPRPYNFNEVENSAIIDEIQSLLKKGVIKQVDSCEGEYISNIFVRPKKDGRYRMILNLKDLNESVCYHHFKMSTLKSAIDLMTENCYMASLDWKDAYYCVAIADSDKKLLRFQFNDVLFEFQALPNGLASGPRIFTKITKPFFSFLRRKGFLNTPYIDDCFLAAPTLEECKQNVIETVELSWKAGFVDHPIKSNFEPSQIIEYLGFCLDSIEMKVSVNSRQALKIKNACAMGLNSKQITILDLSKIVGLMVASFPGVEYGPLFYRKLDNAKTKALRDHKGNYSALIQLSDELKQDLRWWVNNIDLAYCPINYGNTQLTISSDASPLGWGASCHGTQTGGNWNPLESKLHINMLELKAAFFGLRCFAQDNLHIKLLIDNTTALAYIANMGGKLFELNNQARELWLWCKQRGIWLTVAYITSANNYEADAESRMVHDNLEWKLNKFLFDKICNLFTKPSTDLFASRLNFQVNNYIAWKPDPYAMAVDAFTVNWGELGVCYAFPPFSIISKILRKIECDKVEEMILIVPFWTTQPWFSKLGKLLIDCPFLLPRGHNTVTHPMKDTPHALNDKLNLVACFVSGNVSRTLAFQDGLRTSCCPHGRTKHNSNTAVTLTNGFNFVVNQTPVLCHRI